MCLLLYLQQSSGLVTPVLQITWARRTLMFYTVVFSLQQLGMLLAALKMLLKKNKGSLPLGEEAWSVVSYSIYEGNGGLEVECNSSSFSSSLAIRAASTAHPHERDIPLPPWP